MIDGRPYRDRSLINGTLRDFALAVFGTATNGFTSPPPPVAQCTVDWNTVFQRIDGFGASSAWRGTWNNKLADMLFSTNNGIIYTNTVGGISTNNGIALSLLRSRINPTGGTDESSIMQLAQARGAKVWSTPWTPPVQDKDSRTNNGGNYLGSGANATNLAYAKYLANYVVQMKAIYGVNIYAVSVQNEPDGNHPTTYATNKTTGIITTNAGYESCVWTGQQIHDFTTNFYNTLVASNVVSTKIMLPESQNWLDPAGEGSIAMNDPNVAATVGILANHNYDGVNGTTAAVNTHGKPLWETEVALLSGSDGTITNGVYYAQRIHLFLTVAQVNAWHYWWLIAGGSAGNEGLMDTTATPTKRMFALGQFARFVRPNFYRINVTNNTSTALISAYKDSLSPNFAVVAVNPSSSSITQTFNLTNVVNVSTVMPWMTTSNLSLSSQAAVTVSNLSFTYTLPAMSIVTFVGQAASNAPPTLSAVSDQTINAGMNLVITNSATDTNVPSPTLTFSLLQAPTNATIDPASGMLKWRPLLSQANTTNLVVTEVADNSVPSLSATNSFKVFVSSVVAPVLSAPAMGVPDK